MTIKSVLSTNLLKYQYSIGIAFAQRGRGFSSPVDLAFSKTGKMFVVSRHHSGTKVGLRIGICDPDFNAEYFGEFGIYGYDPGQFIWPTALAFDRDDVLYLADEHLNSIIRFDIEGNYIDQWGSFGTDPGQLRGPSGMVFDKEDNLYIVDHLNNRVQKFTKNGQFIAMFGSFGDKDGQFSLPWGITLDKEENIYVADWRNDRIQKFNSEGGFITKFGSFGNGDGQFYRPSSVAVDSGGYIFITDWGNERVQVLDSDGKFLQNIRGESGLSKWAEEYFESNVDEAEARSRSNLEPELGIEDPWQESSFIEKLLWGPISVKLDNQEKLFITETNRHRVQIYQKG
mgnify:CR=1 FL=1